MRVIIDGLSSLRFQSLGGFYTGHSMKTYINEIVRVLPYF